MITIRECSRTYQTANKMFPFDATIVENFCLVATNQRNSVLWYPRYEHLNIKGLKALSQKGTVRGLPHNNQIEICEGWVLGNQTRSSFLTWRARRASSPLALVHADVCDPMQIGILGGKQLLSIVYWRLHPHELAIFSQCQIVSFGMFQKV